MLIDYCCDLMCDFNRNIVTKKKKQRKVLFISLSLLYLYYKLDPLMCIGFQLLVLHQYARTRCVCDFSDLLLCVPFSLRLPIAHISCTSMARYLNAFSTLCHFFCLSITFSRSFFISNVFRWTVLFYSKQNIFSPFGRFLPDNFEVYRIFFCHYCCCCCCPIEPIFCASIRQTQW